MRCDPADLGEEYALRAVSINDAPLRDGARYVLCWLQQTLRGHDHPTIDAAVILGNRLGLPVLVYHGLREDYPHASERLHRFILGASRAMAQTLAARGIACVQHVDRTDHRERGLVYRLAADAAAVFVDEHATFVGASQAAAFAARAHVATVAVDATRLVPFRALSGRLHATKAFRAAHTPLRSTWRALRSPVEPAVAPYAGPLCFAPDRLVLHGTGEARTHEGADSAGISRTARSGPPPLALVGPGSRPDAPRPTHGRTPARPASPPAPPRPPPPAVGLRTAAG